MKTLFQSIIVTLLLSSSVTPATAAGPSAPRQSFSTDLWPGEGIPTFVATKNILVVYDQPGTDAKILAKIKSDKKKITADEHLLSVTKPAVMTYKKGTEITATCFGTGRELSKDSYYKGGVSKKLKIAAQTISEYLVYRAEGSHIVRIDGDLCEVDEGSLGTKRHVPALDWWIKITYDKADNKKGWIRVGEGVKESGRQF